MSQSQKHPDNPRESQPRSSEPVAAQLEPGSNPTPIKVQDHSDEIINPPQQKRKRGRPPKPHPPAAAPGADHLAQSEDSPAPASSAGQPRPRGAPKGNAYAAKPGSDLRVELYLSKTRRAYFEQWFELRYGIKAASEEELREAVRQIADRAITQTMIEEFERHRPDSVLGSGGEVF